jgi:Tetratricopeptide repeat/Glycosyltransferase family 9 (heptosyltransferase)
MSGAVGLSLVPPAGMQLPQALQLVAEHLQNGKLDEAEALLADTRKAAPDHPHAIHLQGIISFRRGQIAEACTLMERSIGLAPNVPLYARNICEVYRALGRNGEAVAAGRRAVALAPDDLYALLNLAMAHYERQEIAEALAYIEHALTIAPELPNAHFQRAECLLLSSRFEEGWEEYEWRFKLSSARKLMPDTDKPQWDGRRMDDGRLLLIADQGFGDVIQFSRYIPWAASQAAELVMACGSAKRLLLAQFPELKSLHRRWETVPEWTAYVPLSGLPRLHGTRLENIPALVPYLRADPALVERWAGRLDRLLPPGYRRVGIAWAGLATHGNDRNRSTTLAALAPLARLDKVALVSLAKGPAVTQVGQYFGHAPLLNLGPEIRDFRDTMAVLECVDLLVTVDTAVGHLAGAMGRPAWLMLAHAPDWRWLRGRDDTPWYPSLRLFRQRAPRDWRELTERIAAALARRFEAGAEAAAKPRSS